MIYTLTNELEDLLAVTYVMNAMLYILENDEGATRPANPPPVPRPSTTFASFVNHGVQETKREAEEVPKEMGTSVQSVASLAESVSPQDPTGSRTVVVPEAQQQSVPTPAPQPDPTNYSQTIQIEGRKEALSTPGILGNRILAKLQEENETLSEQVEVLDKMNERLGKKVKDLESKLRGLDGTVEEMEEKDRQLERLKREDEIKNQTLSGLLVKMEEMQKELVLNNSSLTETTERLKETTKKLVIEQKRAGILETEVKHYLTDQPTIENFHVLKSCLHPEMEKYAVEAVRDAIGKRELRGDAATAYVSKYFDELYGTHWQCVLFRSDGHGCLVQHNNNCFIRFQLGNYELLLFRY